MRATHVAVVAAFCCTLPPVAWAVAQVALTAGDVAATVLAPAVIGLWLAQASCIAALLPSCVTLWRTREAAAGVILFVLFPLPALTLAWLAGVYPAHTLIAAPLLLAGGGTLVLAVVALMMRVLRTPVLASAGMLVVQLSAGLAALMFADTWLGWAGV